MKLSKQRTSLDVRKFSFSQLVVREWNKLSQDVVHGCYVCELVQEQIGQVLAKIWALKARLNQPIIRQVGLQVHVKWSCTQPGVLV